VWPADAPSDAPGSLTGIALGAGQTLVVVLSSTGDAFPAKLAADVAFADGREALVRPRPDRAREMDDAVTVLPARGPDGDGGDSVARQLRDLALLHRSGDLSDDEYAAAKRHVLGG
jgi:hypothetical protein